MTAASVTGLHKAYGTHPVLTGVDMSVPEGSLTAILGVSGSGKTTLLRLLAGFERVDRGTIRLGEEVVDDGRRRVPPERRQIGYVPQEGALFPHLTVAGNIRFGLPRRQRRGGRVEELLELVGLADFAGRYPHQLSGGQQQRVALARALARRPRLVLLDEPFSALDAGMRAAVRAEVHQTLRAAGATAVLVTHDQDEALSMADQVAVLRAGRIIQQGTPLELYSRPADPELAGFVGDANLLPGTADGDAATSVLGRLPIRHEGAAHPADGPALVLVRPEQLRLLLDDAASDSASDAAAPAAGLRGRVRRCEYYGHDTVVSVEPLAPCGVEVLHARLPEGVHIAPDTPVTVTATGEVTVWPSPSREGDEQPADPPADAAGEALAARAVATG